MADGSGVRGAPTEHEVAAKRAARSGRLAITEDTEISDAVVDYMVRYGGLEELNTDWWLVDGGQEYRIDSVHEPPIGRRQFLSIRARART